MHTDWYSWWQLSPFPSYPAMTSACAFSFFQSSFFTRSISAVLHQLFPCHSPHLIPKLSFYVEYRRVKPGLDSEAGFYKITSFNYFFLVSIYTGLHSALLLVTSDSQKLTSLGIVWPKKRACQQVYSTEEMTHLPGYIFSSYNTGILRITAKTDLPLLQSSPFQIVRHLALLWPFKSWHVSPLS